MLRRLKGGGDVVCLAGAVFPGSDEEEEGDPGEVYDSFFSLRAAAGD